jgi:hypothetical protein
LAELLMEHDDNLDMDEDDNVGEAGAGAAAGAKLDRSDSVEELLE